MIEKLKKMLEDAYDKSYQDGYNAGYNARALEDKEDNSRRLLDAYHDGIAQGRREALEENGIIELTGLEEMLEEEDV